MKKMGIVLGILLASSTSWGFLTMEQEACFVKTQMPWNQFYSPNKAALFNLAVDLVAEEVAKMNMDDGFTVFSTTKGTDSTKDNLLRLTELTKSIPAELRSMNLFSQANRAYNQGLWKSMFEAARQFTFEARDDVYPTGFFGFFGLSVDAPEAGLAKYIKGSFVAGMTFVPVWVEMMPKQSTEGFCELVFANVYGRDENGNTKEAYPYGYWSVDTAATYIPVKDFNKGKQTTAGVRKGMGLFWARNLDRASEFKGLLVAQSMNINMLGKLGTWANVIGKKLNFKAGIVQPFTTSKPPFAVAMFGGDSTFTAYNTSLKESQRTNLGLIYSTAEYNSSADKYSPAEFCLQQSKVGSAVTKSIGSAIDAAAEVTGITEQAQGLVDLCKDFQNLVEKEGN